MENKIQLKLVTKQHKFINELFEDSTKELIYYEIYVYRKEENNEYTFVGKLDERSDFVDKQFTTIQYVVETDFMLDHIHRKFYYQHYKTPILEIVEYEYTPIIEKTKLYCVIKMIEFLSTFNEILINWDIFIYDAEPNGNPLTKVLNKVSKDEDDVKQTLENTKLIIQDEIKRNYNREKDMDNEIDYNLIGIEYIFTDIKEIDYLIKFNKQYIIKKVSDNNSNPKNYPLKLTPLFIPEKINKHHKDYSKNYDLIVSSDSGLKQINKYQFLINYDLNE